MKYFDLTFDSMLQIDYFHLFFLQFLKKVNMNIVFNFSLIPFVFQVFCAQYFSQYDFSCRNNYIFVLMSQINKKKSEGNVKKEGRQNFEFTDIILDEEAREEKLLHLRTILILTQLNSSYHELQISFQKTFAQLEQRLTSDKIHGFQKIKLRQYDLVSRIISFKQPQLSTQNQAASQLEINNNTPSFHQPFSESIVQRQKRTEYSIKTKIKRLAKILHSKNHNICQYFFLKLVLTLKSQNTNLNSQKSSKIQTNDTSKNKIFKRSTEKRNNRKYFSLEKSLRYAKPHDQESKRKDWQKNQLIYSRNSENDFDLKMGNTNSFERNLDKLIIKQSFNPTLQYKTREKRKSFKMKERKILKTNSSKRLNMSMAVNQKEQKIAQLQYLKKKYKKLISQFNWFCERFLKVIEEEQYPK